MQRFLFTLFLLLAFLPKPYAQQEQQPKKPETEFANKILNFQFVYTYNVPGDDLAKRFGPFHGAGAGMLFKTKRNFLYSFDANYYFGGKINEDTIFRNLVNSSGYIMNTGGYPASYSVSMRGLSSSVRFGKLFPVSDINRNSGIFVMGGVGILAHNISIITRNNDVATLTDDMKKGYDRLTRGFTINETVGYYHHSHNRFINFYLGLDCTQGFTQSVRKFNYDTMLPDTEKRLDLMWSIKFGWMIPMYLTTKGQDEFNFR